MAEDAFAAAEKRGYAKGYAAGKRRVGREVALERQERIQAARENAFWQKAFFAAFTTCVDMRGWTSGDKPISTPAERADLAKLFANEALRVARFHGRV